MKICVEIMMMKGKELIIGLTHMAKEHGVGLEITLRKIWEVYKQFKENYIKQVADYYKDRIPKKLYDAMYGYEIHIDDWK